MVGTALGLLLVAGFATVTGVAPSLPGPPLRKWLGLADIREVGCRPQPSRVRSPAAPAPTMGSWKRQRPSPRARVEVDAAVLGERIYTVGGQGADGSVADVLMYDPAVGRYRRAADLPRPLDHVGAVAWSGQLYVAGGLSNADPRAELWRYSPSSGRWKEESPMRVARGAHGAAVIGDRLYIVGGAPPSFPDEYVKPFATLEVYDFRTGRWSAGPDMPTPRHHLAAVGLGGKLYAIGGHAPHDFSLATFERFDPVSRRWERLPDLPLGVRGLDAVAVGGEVVVTGGGNEQDEKWVTPAVWAFHPERGSWRRLPDLATARHGHAAAALGGRAFVFEGAACAGFHRMRRVESLVVGPPDAEGKSPARAAVPPE